MTVVGVYGRCVATCVTNDSLSCFHPRLPMTTLWMEILLPSETFPFATFNGNYVTMTLDASLPCQLSCQNLDMYTWMYKTSWPPLRLGVGSWGLMNLSHLQEHHLFTMRWKPCGSHSPTCQCCHFIFVGSWHTVYVVCILESYKL